MPEGHTIHRYARLHRADLVDRAITVTSPQGRFSSGAEQLDGQVMEGIDAYGKHLFYRWEGGEVLHVHLGLFGKFKTHRGDPPPPTEGTRLAMATDEATIYLAGPTACDLITDDEHEEIVGRLGPDPLRRGASFEDFSARLDRRTIPVAAALLDQKVIAGVGNVYRAEVLFLAGIHPHRRARDLTDAERELVWTITSDQLRRGQKAGRIVTVDPTDVGAKRVSDLDARTRLYVYKRTSEPCRRCEEPIRLAELANRKVWWCPTCQPD